MGFDDLCNKENLVLDLGLSVESYDASKKPSSHHQNLGEVPEIDRRRRPSLTLSLFGDHPPRRTWAEDGFGSDLKTSKKNGNFISDQIPSGGDVISPASSLSNVSVKREREVGSEEVAGGDEHDDDDDGSNGRKKLRLNKAQSAVLEESFKQHVTLNPNQKQELARKLNLRPRQVEVWFQNRRARTKLKQTEMDCELLKKCCETLTEENRRLQKEVQELKAFKLAPPPYMQFPAATLTMCPSCERVGGGGAAVSDFGTAKGGGPFAIAAASAKSSSRLYQPFTNPSAAC